MFLGFIAACIVLYGVYWFFFSDAGRCFRWNAFVDDWNPIIRSAEFRRNTYSDVWALTPSQLIAHERLVNQDLTSLNAINPPRAGREPVEKLRDELEFERQMYQQISWNSPAATVNQTIENLNRANDEQQRAIREANRICRAVAQSDQRIVEFRGYPPLSLDSMWAETHPTTRVGRRRFPMNEQVSAA